MSFKEYLENKPAPLVEEKKPTFKDFYNKRNPPQEKIEEDIIPIEAQPDNLISKLQYKIDLLEDKLFNFENTIVGPSGPRGEKGEVGRAGINGKQVEVAVNEEKLQWRYLNEEWQDILYLENLIGEAGPQGLQGVAGKDGEKGEQGPEGKQGKKGQRGEKGEQGFQGLQGEVGKQGLDGRHGIDGEIGPTGPQGEKGEKGDRGSTGLTGPKGDKGDKGDNSRTIELVRESNTVFWKYADEDKKIPLFTLSEIMAGQAMGGGPGPKGVQGERGLDGGQGVDGRKVELRTSSGFVQMRYEGDTEWITLYEIPTGGVGGEEVNYAKKIDFNGDYIYKGEAVTGSLTGSPVWRISRTYLDPGDGDATVVWADGDDNFDNIWDNHATTISYS